MSLAELRPPGSTRLIQKELQERYKTYDLTNDRFEVSLILSVLLFLRYSCNS